MLVANSHGLVVGVGHALSHWAGWLWTLPGRAWTLTWPIERQRRTPSWRCGVHTSRVGWPPRTCRPPMRRSCRLESDPRDGHWRLRWQACHVSLPSIPRWGTPWRGVRG